MEGILGTIAEQWPMAALIVIVVFWLLSRQDKLEKAQDERRAKEREHQADEAEKQRKWSEEQGKKRDDFQRELITHTNTFIKGLQEDQQKSINLLNESIQLVASKTDLVLNSLNHHHSYTERSMRKITKMQGGYYEDGDAEEA